MQLLHQEMESIHVSTIYLINFHLLVASTSSLEISLCLAYAVGSLQMECVPIGFGNWKLGKYCCPVISSIRACILLFDMLNSIGLLSWLSSITIFSRCNTNANITHKLESIEPIIIWSGLSLYSRTFLLHLMLDLSVYKNSIFAVKSSHFKCSTSPSLAIMWNWKRKYATPVYLPRLYSGNLWHCYSTSRNSSISIVQHADDALPPLLTLCFFTLLMSSFITTDFVGFPELLCKSHFMSSLGIKDEIAFFEYSIVEDIPCVGLSVAYGLVVPKSFKVNLRWMWAGANSNYSSFEKL